VGSGVVQPASASTSRAASAAAVTRVLTPPR
jgi:hypothetical protein